MMLFPQFPRRGRVRDDLARLLRHNRLTNGADYQSGCDHQDGNLPPLIRRIQRRGASGKMAAYLRQQETIHVGANSHCVHRRFMNS